MAKNRPVYLDCNATTPVDPRVISCMNKYLEEEYGNANSRTHIYGARARKAVETARRQIAAAVAAEPDQVIFTSGATESNNLVLLGLAAYGEKTGRTHLVSTAMEHKAVLEPLQFLETRGFSLTLVPPTKGGWVEPKAIRKVLTPDTLLVSIMQVNNETGVVQPLAEIAQALGDHPAFLHTDAAQGFGKDPEPLRNPRVDFISMSGHKIYGPKGVGALVTRRRGFKSPPLAPIMFGGGHERGLRPGTLAVPLLVGFGKATELAANEGSARTKACRAFRDRMLRALEPLAPIINGDPDRTLPHVLNLSFVGLDAEAVMLALKDTVSISNGSACTSDRYEPSHVLLAMGVGEDRAAAATRWSWSHMTAEPDWDAVVQAISALL